MIFMKKSAKNILLSFLAISSLMSCQSANNKLDIVTDFDDISIYNCIYDDNPTKYNQNLYLTADYEVDLSAQEISGDICFPIYSSLPIDNILSLEYFDTITNENISLKINSFSSKRDVNERKYYYTLINASLPKEFITQKFNIDEVKIVVQFENRPFKYLLKYNVDISNHFINSYLDISSIQQTFNFTHSIYVESKLVYHSEVFRFYFSNSNDFNHTLSLTNLSNQEIFKSVQYGNQPLPIITNNLSNELSFTLNYDKLKTNTIDYTPLYLNYNIEDMDKQGKLPLCNKGNSYYSPYYFQGLEYTNYFIEIYSDTIEHL